jgi:ribosomal protein L11 methyltransferase
MVLQTMISASPIIPFATWVALLEADEQAARRIADLVCDGFAGDGVAVSLADTGGGRWRVAIHLVAAPDETAVRALVAAAAGRAAAKALRFESVTAKDWVRESIAGLKPVAAGRFIVHGAHDRGRVPLNRIGIEIEAALAFGTGHHGTTRGCLLALDRICKSLGKPRAIPVRRHPEVRAKRASKDVGRGALRGSALRAEHLRVTDRHAAPRILDLGTGSGVLAIAAARALRQKVLATDIDESAVRVARANVRLNRVGPLIEIVQADGVAARSLRRRAPFDLVFANILLGPLQRIAAPLAKLAAPGARIVLSGLLPVQANAALAAYRGFALERRIALEGWTTLVLARRQRAGVAGREPTP